MDEENHEFSLCPNCGTRLEGQFCYACGQNQQGFDRFFLSLISEAFEDLISQDSRAIRTLFALLLRPGFLTLEYFRGRRARYVQPLRLYFITSLVCFFALSLQTKLSPAVISFDNSQQDIVIGVELGNTDDPVETNDITAKQTNDATNDPTDNSANTDDASEYADTAPSADENTVVLEDLHFDFLTEEQNQKLIDFYTAQIEKTTKIASEDPSQFIDMALDSAPILVFCLLPIFALLLKVIYFNTGRYYTEHLVFAVHIHCFLYTINLVDLAGYLIGDPIAGGMSKLINVWVVIYLLLGLRNTYKQGWGTTVFKFFALTISYVIAFMVAVSIAAIVNVTIL